MRKKCESKKEKSKISEESAITCCSCGAELDENEVYLFDNQDYCEDCFYDNTFICDSCGGRFHIDDENSVNNDSVVCDGCYDEYYTSCYQCGRIILREEANYSEDNYDDEPLCDDCYERECGIKYLHDYSYKPDPIFRGAGNRYFGAELEIDRGGKDEDNACKLCEEANKHCENIYIKTDSSLNDGLEIVTHPMTLDYHINNMPWENICDMALRLGYRSHNTSTSGLHIHVNRTAFGNTLGEQDECIARILYFFENNWCELLRFSRRNAEQLNHWAKRYGWKESPEAVLDDAKSKRGERYTCVNITNYSTIEFRIFRGTLKYNTIIATLQLVDAICDMALFLSDNEIKNLAWSEFTAGLDKKKYPQLIRYLKERRLNINEPITNDETEE